MTNEYISDDMPVLKPFICDNKYYIYDTYKNQIIHISKGIYVEINRLLRVGIKSYLNLSEDSPERRSVLTLFEKGYLQKSNLKKITNYDHAYIPQLLERSISTLQLQVTRNCNFSCRYCPLANSDEIIHKQKETCMSLSTAKNSVDYLYNHAKDVNKVYIYYYGGEPLLSFELIKQTTLYAKSKFFSKEISFVIITNGALLNDNIIDFLVENNFVLIISFDGEEKIQNNHRKQRINGEKTYNKVLNNILHIKNNYSTYYKKNVKFNAVSFYDEDRKRLYDFFLQKLEKDNHAINLIFPDIRGIDYVYNMWALKQGGIKENFIKKEHEKFINIYRNKNESNDCIWYGSGNCIPGVQKLFVSVDGLFYPCEKVVEDKFTCIGSLEKGFDVEKIIQISDIPNITLDHCKKCWAFKFCSTCICYCADNINKKISKEVRLDFCKQTLSKTLDMLKAYVREESE